MSLVKLSNSIDLGLGKVEPAASDPGVQLPSEADRLEPPLKPVETNIPRTASRLLEGAHGVAFWRSFASLLLDPREYLKVWDAFLIIEV
jgi:hypothetical protein